MTDLEKALILEQIYAYTDDLVDTEVIEDTGLIESITLRLQEIDDLIRQNTVRYEETLLLIDSLGVSDGPTSS